MKIVTIIGARPQFIKAAAVSREIAKHPDIREIIVHTGQHFDANMSDVFFEEMQIPKPHYLLEVHSLSHGAMTGRMLEKIEEVLIKEKPDFVMVYGDTNSTLAGALAAKKLHIKVVHVEAGLRSFNMRMPEEVNRILTDRISDILCCPTDNAVANLKREGFDYIPCEVVNTGDVMLDAAIFYSAYSAEKSRIVQNLKLEQGKFILCTIHRAENTDNTDRLKSIVQALNNVAQRENIVLPLHPRTQKILQESKIKLNFVPLDPIGYFDMIELLKNTACVMTDSGGLQKEAYFFGKPCITLRDETEWIELVESGVNLLVGADSRSIIDGYYKMIAADLVLHEKIYGTGKAAESLVAAITN